jgi:hypothetical protein
VALVGLLLTTGCDEQTPVDPGQLPSGGGETGSSGGGTSDSTSLGDESLVGTWLNSRAPANDQNVSAIITTWVFRADGVCARSLVSDNVTGPSTVELRVGVCRVTAPNTIAVLFTQESVPFTMTYDFPTVATLTLDGLLYDQVASQ